MICDRRRRLPSVTYFTKVAVNMDTGAVITILSRATESSGLRSPSAAPVPILQNRRSLEAAQDIRSATGVLD
jgi:hypothetical protein